MKKGQAVKKLNSNIYSVDMVRLKVRVDSELVKEWFDRYSCDSSVEYWETCRVREYRHNWKFSYSYSDGVIASFWVGYQHNREIKGYKHWLVIEYNPSKNFISGGSLNDILRYFFNNDDVIIVSCDLACDMPVNINSVFCDKGGKSIKKIFDYGGNNKTIYLGEGDGRIKIYNKARELGISDIELTRYEISVQVDLPVRLYSVFNENHLTLVPIYCVDSYQFDMTLNETDKALLYAVLNGYPIEALSRRKGENIKKILSESAGNTLESTGFINAFKDYFRKHNSILNQC